MLTYSKQIPVIATPMSWFVGPDWPASVQPSLPQWCQNDGR